MPRTGRAATGGLYCHVLNRGNARAEVFHDAADYAAFVELMALACRRVPMRVLGWCLMPNHFHLVVWPRGDGDLSEFMRWLTVTHTQRLHARRGTAGCGHVYQGRFKSFPVQASRATAARRRAGWLAAGNPVLSVLRYVERNPLRASLVGTADEWTWSSVDCRGRPGDAPRPPLTAAPGPKWCGQVRGARHQTSRKCSRAAA